MLIVRVVCRVAHRDAHVVRSARCGSVCRLGTISSDTAARRRNAGRTALPIAVLANEVAATTRARRDCRVRWNRTRRARSAARIDARIVEAISVALVRLRRAASIASHRRRDACAETELLIRRAHAAALSSIARSGSTCRSGAWRTRAVTAVWMELLAQVPLQTWNPVSHMRPHDVPSQVVAEAFVPRGQAEHDPPQWSTLVSSTHWPPQSWKPT